MIKVPYPNQQKTFNPCEHCSKEKPGYILVKLQYQTGYKECDCHKRWRFERKVNTLFLQSGLNEKCLDYNPYKDYIGHNQQNLNRLIKYAEHFEQYASEIVYLYGPAGSQKTTLASWVGLTVVKKGYSVKYVLMQDLMKMLVDNFEQEDQEDRKEQVNRVLNVDFLIVDDSFSSNKVTLYRSGYQLPFLESFLRKRKDELKKGMLFISNHPPTEIAQQKFSESIQDYIVRNTRHTTLLFDDVYWQIANKVDVNSLFD